MYEKNLHIQEAPKERFFGRRQEYRYRMLGKDGESVIHHTNSFEDAERYFQKCREHWLASSS